MLQLCACCPGNSALCTPTPHLRTFLSVDCLRYGAHYVWGQLSTWYKQTVYDPTVSLSADRRGTLSLPDIENCYTAKEQYDLRVSSTAQQYSSTVVQQHGYTAAQQCSSTVVHHQSSQYCNTQASRTTQQHIRPGT
jgi:hypothetical protein